MEHRVGTYSKIYLHFVFAVKYRQAIIRQSWEEELYQYITGIVKNKGQLMIAINGHLDHIHILIALRPSCCISDLVREIKKSSTEFINEKRFTKSTFAWQEGYGVFSYTHWDINTIINYIKKQKEHHAAKKFRDEYYRLLKDWNIDYNSNHLFDWEVDPGYVVAGE